MERTANKSDINSLKDLSTYRLHLQRLYQAKENNIKGDIRLKVIQFPSRLFKQSSPKTLNNSNLNQLMITNSVSLVKALLPKSVGFFSKWLVGVIAKKSVTRILR